MLLEYLFFDKNSRIDVETLNVEIMVHWDTSKDDPYPPDIRYNNLDSSDHWIVSYEKSGNNELNAKRFSELNEKICKEFSPIILTDESSEYFNKSLYPLVNKFERCLRKLLYFKVALCNEDKLQCAILDLEKKDFGEIYNILFVDNNFRSTAREKIKKLNTRAEMLEAIDSLSERTAWDMLIGKSVLDIIKDNFDLLKEYRNDVMHAHNISYEQYKEAKKLFIKANEQLEEQVDKILLHPSEWMLSGASVNMLYDRLVTSSDDLEKIANEMTGIIELVAKLSSTSISSGALTNIDRIMEVIRQSADSVNGKLYLQNTTNRGKEATNIGEGKVSDNE